MKLSFQVRVLATVVGAVLVAGGAAIGGFALAFRLHMRSPIEWSVSSTELAACRADPAGWTMSVPGLAEVMPYTHDGRALRPGVADLSAAEVARVHARGFAVEVVSSFRREVKQMAPDGPCALVELRLYPPSGGERTATVGALAGASGVLLLVSLSAMAFVVWPVLRRVDSLRASAERVGTLGYDSADDEVGDAISGIGAVLDASHARLTALESDLRARQDALELHLAEIAHDLRTPLASLLLALQDASAESGSPAVSRALADVESVSALVDNLHQGSRMRRGADVTEGHTDLREVVSRLGVRFTALARLRDISVEVAVPEEAAVIVGAPPFVERALSNLVHNAVVHGEAGGHVAFVLEVDANEFEVHVIDDGPGLPEDTPFDLNMPTFRKDAARGRSLGLGLAITHAVAERLGWSVTFEREEPRGLRVTVRGPR